MRKRWCLFAVPLLICPSAHAEDLSAESLSSLSSVGSSTRDVVRDASSLSSIPELSSQSLDGAAGNTPGKLDAKKWVLGTNGKRIRYTSVNERGEKVPVTGALYDRPFAKGLIVLAPGTRGLGDQCAPSAGSSMLSSLGPNGTVNINYEAPMVQMLLDDGYRVVVTDYMGLGTDGLHTYLNRVDQGRAVIDAARAVAKRGEKVAFWGYSQGGGAAAAAAELVGDYAPELNVVGTFSGAPPADPLGVLQQASAPMLTAVAGFAAASYSETYPEFHEALDGYLTDDGKALLEDLKTSCVVDASMNAPKVTDDMFVDGKTFAEIAEEDERIGKYLEHNKLGKVKPNAPIMVLTNPDDDLVPEPQATQLAEDYCAIGADVEYRRVVVPGSPTQPLSSGRRELTPRAPGSGHALPLLLQTGNVSDWLSDRFKGRPMKQVCPSDHPEYEVVEGLNAVEITAIVFSVLGTLGALGLWAYAYTGSGPLPSLPSPPSLPSLPF